MRSALLWLIGIPIPLILLLAYHRSSLIAEGNRRYGSFVCPA